MNSENQDFYMQKHLRAQIMLCACLYSSHSKAQLSVTGQVTDSTGAPLPYCVIGLISATDSAIVKGAMSDDRGDFSFEKVRAGSYMLKYTNSGYNTVWSERINVDSLTPVYKAPVVALTRGDVALNEVSVSVFRPTVEFENGKVVLNIENNALAAVIPCLICCEGSPAFSLTLKTTLQ